MSLRSRVLLGMAVVAGMVIATAVVTVRLTHERLLDQIDQGLIDSAPSDHDGGAEEDRRPPPTDDERPRFSAYYFAEISSDGELVTLAEANATGETLAPPEIDIDEAVEAAAAVDTTRLYTVGSTGGGGLEYRVAVGPTRGDAVFVVAAPLNRVAESVSQIRRITAVIALVVLLILAAVAWWVLRLGVRPVKQMTQTAMRIADDDLGRRVPVSGPRTEAGQLGIALNSMLERLEAAFDERARTEERLRRFVGDASHELRTPVQTVRGYAELYRLGALSEPERLDDAMRRTEAEAVRMAALVDELLTLARYDQGRPLQRKEVDVAALARDAAADAAAIQPTRPLVVDAAGSVVVNGDEHSLRQVFANLVGNALVHTPVDTQVSISVRGLDGSRGANEHRVEIVVRDQGAGMNAAVAERVFERFFRADPARARGHGGSGLGLAIVDAAVRAHGGDIELTSTPGVGTTFRVQLPRRQPLPPEL